MHVELFDGHRYVYWCGSKGGVDLRAYVDVQPDMIQPMLGQHRAGVQRLVVQLLGTSTVPDVTIRWRSPNRPPLVEDVDADLIECVRQWVTNGDPLGWKQEVAGYQSALSRVNLPHALEDVKDRADKVLMYKLVAEHLVLKIIVSMEVGERITNLYVDLNDGGDDYISVGHCTLDGIVSLDTVRAAVLPAMTRFLEGVQHLMERVAQPVDNT